MVLTNGKSFWTRHFSADEFGEHMGTRKPGGIFMEVYSWVPTGEGHLALTESFPPSTNW